MARPPVTLQVNVAPTDLPHARHVLAHQLRQWGAQTEEVLFTFDLHRTAKGGRFAEGWEERLGPMRELLEELCASHHGARVEEVDYSTQRMSAIAAELFGAGVQMPTKDTRGGPFYSYFHGLLGARHDLVLHVDSDMLFGGGSQTWAEQASGLLAADPQVLACNPYPGPPAPPRPSAQDGAPPHHVADPYAPLPGALRFQSFNTRLFLIDRARLRERLLPLALLGPISVSSRVKARLHGNPPFAAPERIVTEAMRGAGMFRVDFLGHDPGMWSLHPPYRSPEFYRELPRLIEQVETGRLPAAQLGDYELGDAMIDWTRARRRAKLRRIWA
ncbi:MAG: hypothetical protein ACYDC2_06240 [Solirubrobacteraceae bacterium]